MKRVRLSASRTATSTLPNFAVVIQRPARMPRPSASPESTKSPARVVSAESGNPSTSRKSVSPLLPPKPISLRKKASISA